MTDESCASGDCSNDTLTEQYKSINESLNEYVKANVELATWMLENQNAQLKELLKECRSFIARENSWNYSPEADELITKIDEVLDE